MIKGVFVQNTPWVKIVLGWGQSVQTPFAVLDTGFSGDLQVTPQIAKDLNLQTTGVTKMQIANGQVIAVPIALALASMEGSKKYIQVVISGGAPLLGISFLSKFSYRATINCKNKTIFLRKVT